jgi:hypothetical protein
MTTLVISALFTQAGGDPATGLALADIDLYLFSRNRTTGAVAAVWNPQNPTEEIGGGLYSRALTTADEQTYDYYAYAQYTGVAILDSNYSLQASPNVPNCCTHSPGAVEFTYTVTDSVTGLPVEGVEVWAALATAPSVVVWSGDTDAFGVARDDFGSKPWLDPGTYRFYKQKAGYLDADTPYDTEVVS